MVESRILIKAERQIFWREIATGQLTVTQYMQGGTPYKAIPSKKERRIALDLLLRSGGTLEEVQVEEK